MRTTSLAALLFVTACGAGSPSTADTGGGNVSFGGAQDIGQFRQTLDDGGIPDPDSLDANGFFNEHYNAAPPADCGDSLCVAAGLTRGYDWVTNTKQDELVIALASPIDPQQLSREPLDLAVVVDRSGSMAEDGRLTKVKHGLDTLIDSLAEGDRLALVAFDDTLATPVTFARVGVPLDRAALHAAVAALQPGGGTDIGGGLDRGFAQFSDETEGARQRRVILLSDGLATAGNTDRTDIIAMADDNAKRGIGLTTVGVGDEFDVDLMRGLAEHGAGNYYFLEDATAADEVFGQELDYFATPIALGVSLSATAAPAISLGAATGSRLYTAQPTGGTLAVPAVFLASRTSQQGEPGRRGGGSVLFVDVTAADPAAPPAQVAHFDLAYTDAFATPEAQVQAQLDLGYGDAEIPTSQLQPYLSQPELAERYAMLQMYRGIARATNEDPACAHATLVRLRTTGAAWIDAHPDPDLAADLALVDEFIANLETGTALGADPDLATCQPTASGSGASSGSGDGPMYGPEPLACSVGGGTSSRALLAPLALGALVSLRRRRRTRS